MKVQMFGITRYFVFGATTKVKILGITTCSCVGQQLKCNSSAIKKSTWLLQNACKVLSSPHWFKWRDLADYIDA